MAMCLFHLLIIIVSTVTVAQAGSSVEFACFSQNYVISC